MDNIEIISAVIGTGVAIIASILSGVWFIVKKAQRMAVNDYRLNNMIGEGASHAWIEIYADGRWTALDPTHDRLVTDDYIKISHGRDYEDCAVERGVFKGNALQIQNVYVKVEEV